MPWEEIPNPLGPDGQIGNPVNPPGTVPTVTKVDVKVEDWHRTDLPGCPRHRTAGAILQHTSWFDPQAGKMVHRFTGYSVCAECGVMIEYVDTEQH